VIYDVLANAFVPTERTGYLYLGADTVGAGDEYRLFVSLDLEKAAEETDVADYVRSESRTRMPGNDRRLDKSVAMVFWKA
jgi:hypothetical protein